jgi:hypothetical protein
LRPLQDREHVGCRAWPGPVEDLRQGEDTLEVLWGGVSPAWSARTPTNSACAAPEELQPMAMAKTCRLRFVGSVMNRTVLPGSSDIAV